MNATLLFQLDVDLF